MNKLTIVSSQFNSIVGDIEGNAQRMIAEIKQAQTEVQADLIIFPELAITGYPPEDLLFRPWLYQRVNSALDQIKLAATNITVIVGYPEQVAGKTYNKAAIIGNQQLHGSYSKQKLPNYTVFDEARYFTEGSTPCVFQLNNITIGVVICEDLWHSGPVQQAVKQGAELIISLNASPFGINQAATREFILKQHTQESKAAILYVNLVGAQDELVFDGGSLAINGNGEICQQAPYFTSSLLISHYDSLTRSFHKHPLPIESSLEEKIYQALTLGLKDYVTKNHFNKVWLGLSGGIDSALSLAIAVDALGADKVNAVMMPSRFNASISLEDAIDQAERMGVNYRVLSIEDSFQSFSRTLADSFVNTEINLAEQNIQARCRAVLLMALSNKFGGLVLTTSNKSEIAVGYSTLYGDMAGGFCVLKDLLKTMVYKLAEYRNLTSPVIPQRVLTRAPSAELAEGQTDQDNLPPYEILDEIIKLYVEQDQDAAAICAVGFDPDVVDEVIRKIKYNEYKRRQAPLGVRLNQRAFGKDRRYPITSGY